MPARHSHTSHNRIKVFHHVQSFFTYTCKQSWAAPAPMEAHIPGAGAGWKVGLYEATGQQTRTPPAQKPTL